MADATILTPETLGALVVNEMRVPNEGVRQFVEWLNAQGIVLISRVKIEAHVSAWEDDVTAKNDAQQMFADMCQRNSELLHEKAILADQCKSDIARAQKAERKLAAMEALHGPLIELDIAPEDAAALQSQEEKHG